MTAPVPRFYRFGDLPPRSEDLARIRRALLSGPMSRQALIARTNLSQTRALCAIDALIAAGEVDYDSQARQFFIRSGG